MSAEVATAGALWKPLAWVFGGLLALIKGLLIYIWVKTTGEIKDNKRSYDELKEKMEDGYYTREHIDLIITPLKQSIDRSNELHEKSNDSHAKLCESVDKLTLKIERLDERSNQKGM